MIFDGFTNFGFRIIIIALLSYNTWHFYTIIEKFLVSAFYLHYYKETTNSSRTNSTTDRYIYRSCGDNCISLISKQIIYLALSIHEQEDKLILLTSIQPSVLYSLLYKENTKKSWIQNAVSILNIEHTVKLCKKTIF